MVNQKKEQKNAKLKKLLKLNDAKKTFLKYGTIIFGVASGSSAVYIFLKEEFGWDILPYFQSAVVVYILLIAVMCLLAFGVVSIYDHVKKVTELEMKISNLMKSSKRVTELEAQSTAIIQERGQYIVEVNATFPKSDSIMAMLTYANDNRQYSEVIKIGTSVSDVLWSTSRKDLRIKVGNMVAAAANELATVSTSEADIDYANRILAKTMIEDIGNTKMCLNADDVDEAIINIQDGIDIAEKHGYHYEAVRGHRNLANCYALKTHLCNKKKDFEQAKKALEHAQKEADLARQSIQLIQDPQKNAEASFDVEYAQAKIQKESGHPEKAVNALEKCIQVYREELQKDGNAKRAYADRIVKVYREMGIVYKSIPGKHKDARNAFQEGLKHAKNRQNHEDVVRCCTYLIQLQIEYRFADTSETVQHWIHDAENNLAMVDTQKHIDDFTKAKQRWVCQNNEPKKTKN